MKAKGFFKNLAFALISFVAVIIVWQWFTVVFAAWMGVFTTIGTFVLGLILIIGMGLGLMHTVGSLMNAVKALFIKEKTDDE
jgi:hypothetical protein